MWDIEKSAKANQEFCCQYHKVPGFCSYPQTDETYHMAQQVPAGFDRVWLPHRL